MPSVDRVCYSSRCHRRPNDQKCTAQTLFHITKYTYYIQFHNFYFKRLLILLTCIYLFIHSFFYFFFHRDLCALKLVPKFRS